MFVSTGDCTLSLPDPTTCKGRFLIIMNLTDDGANIIFNRSIARDKNFLNPGFPGPTSILKYSPNTAGSTTYGPRFQIQGTGDEWMLVGI